MGLRVTGYKGCSALLCSALLCGRMDYGRWCSELSEIFKLLDFNFLFYKDILSGMKSKQSVVPAA
jgi:hypothetical protein